MLVSHLCISPKAQQSKESVTVSSLSWLRGCSIIVLQCDSILSLLTMWMLHHRSTVWQYFLSLLTSRMLHQHSTERHTNATLPHTLMSGACRFSLFLQPTRHLNSKLDSEQGFKRSHWLRARLQGMPSTQSKAARDAIDSEQSFKGSHRLRTRLQGRPSEHNPFPVSAPPVMGTDLPIFSLTIP